MYWVSFDIEALHTLSLSGPIALAELKRLGAAEHVRKLMALNNPRVSLRAGITAHIVGLCKHPGQKRPSTMSKET